MGQGVSEQAEHDVSSDRELRFSAAPKPGRLRMLCLHGHRSNNDITKLQVGNLRLEPAHGVSCDFFEGHIIAPARDSTLAMFSEGPFKTWIDVNSPNESLERSLRDIMTIIETHGPYDGKHVGREVPQNLSFSLFAYLYSRRSTIRSITTVASPTSARP
jgi:hypothetical protein